MLPSDPWKSVLIRGSLLLAGLLAASAATAEEKVPKIALVTTVWYQNSHADVIAGRLLDGYTLDGKGEFPKLKLVSAYVDQFSPRGDKSRDFAKKHSFTIYDSIEKALTLGGDKLAVDGVLMVAEHGEYPESEFGSIQHPKRRFFGEIVKELGNKLSQLDAPSVTTLSLRLQQVLYFLLEGYSEKQVASRLEISPHTVHQYVKDLYRRFQATSRGELLARTWKYYSILQSSTFLGGKT